MRIDNSTDNFIFPSGARLEDNTLIPSKYDTVVLYCPQPLYDKYGNRIFIQTPDPEICAW